MKDKEEVKVKEVNSRSTRRKIKKGTVNKREEELGKTVVLKRKTVAPTLEVPKETNKKEEKVEKKEPVKVETKPEVKKEEKKETIKTTKFKELNGSNKAPYILFTVASIIYFAVTICLAGYISYKVIATVRANKNNNLNTFVSEKILDDKLVFDTDNYNIYVDNHVNNAKVITYYYTVLGTLAISAFLLAIIFSYVSEIFRDKRFANPFMEENVKLVRKCAGISVSILCLSALSAVLQKCFTPFNVSLMQIESIFIIAIALISGAILLKRGNEMMKR